MKPPYNFCAPQMHLLKLMCANIMVVLSNGHIIYINMLGFTDPVIVFHRQNPGFQVRGGTHLKKMR